MNITREMAAHMNDALTRSASSRPSVSGRDWLTRFSESTRRLSKAVRDLGGASSVVPYGTRKGTVVASSLADTCYRAARGGRRDTVNVMYFSRKQGGAMSGTLAFYEFLREARVPYRVVARRPGLNGQEEATAAHVPARNWAKVVVCLVDGLPVQLVLPAPLKVNLTRLMLLARGSESRLVTESELTELYPGYERGALPPFGPLYGQTVFVDVQLASESEIIFSAGTHTDAISIPWAAYAALVRPIVGQFAEPVHDHVAAFRLSYRE